MCDMESYGLEKEKANLNGALEIIKNDEKIQDATKGFAPIGIAVKGDKKDGDRLCIQILMAKKGSPDILMASILGPMTELLKELKDKIERKVNEKEAPQAKPEPCRCEDCKKDGEVKSL